jgi:hypothetical protein
MNKKQIAGVAAAAVLTAGLLTGGAIGAVWLFTPPTHPTVSVSQSHEISTAKQEDAQLAAATSRTASQWTIEQEAAAKKAAEEAAAAALAAQQAAEAQAAADAATQAQATQDAQVATDASAASDDVSTDSASSGEPSGTPLPMVQVTDPNNGQYGQMVIGVDPASWCASHSGTTRGGQPQCT